MEVYLDANIIYDLLLGLATSRSYIDMDYWDTKGLRRSKYLYHLVYTRDQLTDYIEFENAIKDGRIRVFTSRYSEFEAFGAAYKDDFISSLVGRAGFPLPYVLSKVMPKSSFRSILRRHLASYDEGEEMADWCVEFPPKGVGMTRKSDAYEHMKYVENESVDFSQESYQDIISELSKFNIHASDIAHLIICLQNGICYLLTRDRDFHEVDELIKDRTGIVIVKSLRELMHLVERTE